jgi:hypothetical protein
MNLMVWHKVLISAGVACLLFYAGWEARQALSGGVQDALLRSAAATGGGLAFAVYLTRIWRKK